MSKQSSPNKQQQQQQQRQDDDDDNNRDDEGSFDDSDFEEGEEFEDDFSDLSENDQENSEDDENEGNNSMDDEGDDDDAQAGGGGGGAGEDGAGGDDEGNRKLTVRERDELREQVTETNAKFLAKIQRCYPFRMYSLGKPEIDAALVADFPDLQERNSLYDVSYRSGFLRFDCVNEHNYRAPISPAAVFKLESEQAAAETGTAAATTATDGEKNEDQQQQQQPQKQDDKKNNKPQKRIYVVLAHPFINNALRKHNMLMEHQQQSRAAGTGGDDERSEAGVMMSHGALFCRDVLFFMRECAAESDVIEPHGTIGALSGGEGAAAAATATTANDDDDARGKQPTKFIGYHRMVTCIRRIKKREYQGAVHELIGHMISRGVLDNHVLKVPHPVEEHSKRCISVSKKVDLAALMQALPQLNGNGLRLRGEIARESRVSYAERRGAGATGEEEQDGDGAKFNFEHPQLPSPRCRLGRFLFGVADHTRTYAADKGSLMDSLRKRHGFTDNDECTQMMCELIARRLVREIRAGPGHRGSNKIGLTPHALELLTSSGGGGGGGAASASAAGGGSRRPRSPTPPAHQHHHQHHHAVGAAPLDRRDQEQQQQQRDARFASTSRGGGARYDEQRRADDRRDPRFDDRRDPRLDDRRDPRYDDRRDPRFDERRDPRFDDRRDPRFDERRMMPPRAVSPPPPQQQKQPPRHHFRFVGATPVSSPPPMLVIPRVGPRLRPPEAGAAVIRQAPPFLAPQTKF